MANNTTDGLTPALAESTGINRAERRRRQRLEQKGDQVPEPPRRVVHVDAGTLPPADFSLATVKRYISHNQLESVSLPGRGVRVRAESVAALTGEGERTQ